MLTLTTFLVLWAIIGPNFVSMFNLSNVFLQVAVIAIGGTSMVFAITSGGFDLSIGSTLTLTTVVVAMALRLWGLTIPEAIMLAFAIGILCGLLNGVIITKLKIPTFVATLASSLLIRGAALLLSEGRRITINEFIEMKVISVTRFLGFSVASWAMLIIVIIGFLIYRYTRFGVYTRALGSNETALRVSGAKVNMTIILIFVFTALTSVLAGVVQISQTLTGTASTGPTFAIDVITATILGGTTLGGGKGNVLGMLSAAIMLGFVSNGLNMLNVPFYYQHMATGIILIFALLMSGVMEMMRERRS